MESIMFDFISRIRLGELKEFKNLAIIPLFAENGPKSPDYLTMEDAINSRLLIIGEKNSGGSVPELIAQNLAEFPVLLLDGEEVIGAKQNRILNASILLAPKSTTVIPVSCVEAHRWNYTTENFGHSEAYLNYDIRREKHLDVNKSLMESREFHADQGKVWERIDVMNKELNVKSSTGAMHDAYDLVSDRLKKYFDSFEFIEGQNGLFAFIDGKIAGFDALSKTEAFKKVFPKLIKSYAMDAVRADMRNEKAQARQNVYKANHSANLNENVENREVKETISSGARNKAKVSIEQAKYFMDEIKGCSENKFKSNGMGYDFRYVGPYAVGSALIFEDSVIHTAFFKIEKEDITGNMSSYKDRMRSRYAR
ncbi:MAG TPA: DUF6569 family protein [Candidatus Humimicrobiaceae bacterium]